MWHLNLRRLVHRQQQEMFSRLDWQTIWPRRRPSTPRASQTIHGLCSRAAARQRARDLLDRVGLSPAEQFQTRLPKQLSGGQQQRVAIARALALEPKVLICDESVSMLDAEVQTEVLALLRELQRDLGLAMIFVTHDLSVASGFCHRVIVLDKGRIVEEGPGERIFQAPQAAISRTLVDACPRLP